MSGQSLGFSRRVKFVLSSVDSPVSPVRNRQPDVRGRSKIVKIAQTGVGGEGSPTPEMALQ